MKNNRLGKLSCLVPAWAGKNIEAGFTTRNGGVSRPPFNSLNLGAGTDDPKHNVEANRATLARSFDLEPHQLLTVRQVHGTDILIVDDENPDLTHFQEVEADAIITDQPGIMIGVLVADCFPVLIHDPMQKVAAVVRMAKPMWIFEQLRQEKPDIVARYFQTKRKLVTRDKIKRYTADDSVAVLSIAVGRDLFGWFQSLGITVDRPKAQIEAR